MICCCSDDASAISWRFPADDESEYSEATSEYEASSLEPLLKPPSRLADLLPFLLRLKNERRAAWVQWLRRPESESPLVEPPRRPLPLPPPPPPPEPPRFWSSSSSTLGAII